MFEAPSKCVRSTKAYHLPLFRSHDPFKSSHFTLRPSLYYCDASRSCSQKECHHEARNARTKIHRNQQESPDKMFQTNWLTLEWVGKAITCQDIAAHIHMTHDWSSKFSIRVHYFACLGYLFYLVGECFLSPFVDSMQWLCGMLHP